MGDNATKYVAIPEIISEAYSQYVAYLVQKKNSVNANFETALHIM
jgi:hypothetical protein